MKETDQTIFEAGKGNCFAACLASLLEIPIAEVVHFPPGECCNWREIINEWLAPKGLFFIDIALAGDMRDELVRFWGHHIIMGDSPRPIAERHAVVGYKGTMVFDPHPSRAGLVGDGHTYGFLVSV